MEHIGLGVFGDVSACLHLIGTNGSMRLASFSHQWQFDRGLLCISTLYLVSDPMFIFSGELFG